VLRGRGGDGGSTCAESRDSYLFMYVAKKLNKVDPNEARLSRFTCCALSGEPLAAHAVARQSKWSAPVRCYGRR
jgi:hypothetical protein